MGIKSLRYRLWHAVAGVNGEMGISVVDVETGDSVGLDDSKYFPMASVCKTPILVACYRKVERGEVNLGKRVEITASAKTAGSGLLNYMDAGLRPTLRDLLLLMIVVSDNAATDLVLSAIGGPAAV